MPMALLTASTQGINLETLFCQQSTVCPCQAFERLIVPARSSVFLPRFFFSFLQKCHRSASKLARSSPLIRHKTPLASSARFLCVVIGTSSLHRPTWLGGSRATCSHFFTVFLLTHHSLSFEKAKQGGQVVEGILGRYG